MGREREEVKREGRSEEREGRMGREREEVKREGRSEERGKK